MEVQEDGPSPEQRHVISSFHNELSGHFGIQRTVEMLKAAGHTWKHMRKHVEAFVSNCPLCQKLSFVRPLVTATPITTGGALRPMARLCVDTVDVVETDSGYKAVLCVMDSFTRWIELYALKTLDAAEAAGCLLVYIGRYGVPDELLSDRGSQFVNELISELLRSVGTSHVLTLAYSKEENGRIERANREVLRHLRAFVMHSKVVDSWVEKLPFVQRIMNSSVHSLTGHTPAALLFGTAIDLNRSILPPASTSHNGSHTLEIGAQNNSRFFSEWLDKRNEMQRQVLEASAQLQSMQIREHLASVEPEAVTQFAAGDWVQPGTRCPRSGRVRFKLSPRMGIRIGYMIPLRIRKSIDT
jgi:transposase InsO family protein